jgi:hypothetical protein
MTDSGNHHNTCSTPDLRRGEISILLGTRGRPEMLAEVFGSLQKNTSLKDKVAIWLYVDEDDAVTRQAVDRKNLPDPGVGLHWHIGPQVGDLGEMHRVLWQASGRGSEIYMVSVDDARFDTLGWDEIVRKQFAEYPDGAVLAFPHDPMTADVATYPIFGWRWLTTLGCVFPGYFPYWFDDKWVTEIGLLVGRRLKLPIVLFPIRGKGRTKRMRNLAFWTRFFQLTIDERKAAACKLLAIMHPQGGPAHSAALAHLEQVGAKLASEMESYSDIYCVFQEERHTEMTPEERRTFDAKYFKQEALAVARLTSFAEAAAAAGKFAEAMEYLDATHLSDLRVRRVQYLKAECLQKLGRSAEAARLKREALAAWPEHNALRRLFRFLGMVANDGKRMLVGLTQKGRSGNKS